MRSRLFRAAILLLFAAGPLACGGPPPSLDLGWTPDAPAVYRVSAEARSSFSGPVSDLEGATELTAAFRVTPVSDSDVQVETLYFAADVHDGSGNPVALNLKPLAGKKALVKLESPGVVSGVAGHKELLKAPVPLIPVEEVVRSLFPPLPEGSFQQDDTWTGDAPVPFGNLGGDGPVRMRYVLRSIDASEQTGGVEGYELSVEPRAFKAETPSGSVSGEGDLEVEFKGELDAQGGYEQTQRSAWFDSDYIRLQGGDYANGNVHLWSTVSTERLNPAEQFGLDPAAN